MATTLYGKFQSGVYKPGFCHGEVTAQLDDALVDGARVAGVVTFEYEGSYRHGETNAVGVRVTRTGDAVHVALLGLNIFARLAGLSFGPGTISDGVLKIGYRLAMPHDNGTIDFAMPG